jgi:acetoin utilization deacetylase AcuC-like enzyme
VALRIPVVWSERCLLHEPGGEVWIGVRVPGDEVPERALVIREALAAAGAPIVEAESHGEEPLLAAHDPGLVDFLRSALDLWVEAGYPDDPGQDRVVPYIFPHPGFASEAAVPASPAALAGLYAFDTMTPIGPGTWPAVQAAADAALTAAELVLAGEPIAYACTRPPGHHATRSAFGGSCYLNNAVIAAQHLRASGLAKLAIVDIDAHHGNGAQAIFWERDDVFTGSVHVDPAAGWFPHFLGFADETGAGGGSGANLNLPLPPGSGDAEWLAAVETLCAKVEADALVVALGVDAAEEDPESPLRVSAEGFRAAGGLLGALELPTVIVQEGGYALATLGPLVLATLEGFG